jgi:hypothetical protein
VAHGRIELARLAVQDAQLIVDARKLADRAGREQGEALVVRA